MENAVNFNGHLWAGLYGGPFEDQSGAGEENMNEPPPEPCSCNGTGLLHKKAWTQVSMGYQPVHPAIAAVSGAYRTVVSFPCECPLGDKHRQKEQEK